MIINRSNTEIVTNMRENFLKLTREGESLDISQFKKKCVIYIIENLLSHRIYIGKTVDLLNRANHYIGVYRSRDKILNSETNLIFRPIDYAICTEGIVNFRMYPIAIASDRVELAMLEKEYVLKYNSVDPQIGYNTIIPTGEDFRPKVKPIGTPHTIDSKIKKAKLVACINPDEKILFISVGMKLFGDYIKSGKDMVKNCARGGFKHRGFYVVYLNNYDRNCVREKMLKSHVYYKDEYLLLVSGVEMLLDERSATNFIDAGYKCYFLTYNRDGDGETYVFENILNFFDLIED